MASDRSVVTSRAFGLAISGWLVALLACLTGYGAAHPLTLGLAAATPAPTVALDQSPLTYTYDRGQQLSAPMVTTMVLTRRTGATRLAPSPDARGVRPPDAVSRFAAEDTASAARGLSSHGGVLSSEVNEAGGTVWTSSGAISQNDVAPLVNSGMYGGDVNVISGVHGLADGSTIVDPSLYTDDVARFGNLPGVSVHNLPDLSPAEITALLRGPGTTIGAFCDSGACLAPFR